MAIVCQTESFKQPGNNGGSAKRAVFDVESDVVLQNVKTSDFLFQAGDDRTLYRVERGAICHYMLWADGRHEVIEFAFPGDIIGLGQLRTHSTSAQAMVDTVVSLVSEKEFQEILESDDRLSFRLAAAVEREFDYLRDKSLAANEQPASAKVANFLLALSSMNGPEGRDRNLISDEITAGFVAEKLDMSIDKLGAALLCLKKEGAVRETAAGLRIVNTVTLQKMADAA
ncbi:Crp/Fnr family transcriptional regulator [Hyphomicrobium sp.]|uniref:Crp/Fnr family transcriptional regulator n=1 Tax=Hyphomicrobium sp. TaxID=82 RepID=UPI002E355A03|nr:Crp/Fnr family transcriptional regulator [Hyphomicrobium sp.]HEX2842561.1 Crp/Fnr family transcriptional regulator [Hyphomicrobium sp.]